MWAYVVLGARVGGRDRRHRDEDLGDGADAQDQQRDVHRPRVARRADRAAARHAASASPVLALIAAGGVLYTLGAIVLLRRWPDPSPLVFGYHEVWHVMVVTAAACHYAAIFMLVLSC